MRIIACMTVLNEITYLGYTLDTIYPVCDEIIIVENANRFSWDMASSDGLSTDGTTELIEQFPDPQKKINHIKLGRVDLEGYARQAYLDAISDNDVLIMVVSGDEVFFPEDIVRARDFLIENPEYDGVQAKHYFFYHDFMHYIYDKCPNERFFKRGKRGYRFDTMAGDLIEQPIMKWAYLNPPVRLLHFGRILPVKRLFQKGLYTCRYSQIFNAKELVGLTDTELAWEVLTQCYQFTGNLPIDCRVIEYDGEFPEPFKKHPYFNKNRDEIFSVIEYNQLLTEVKARLNENNSWDTCS